MGTSGIIHLGFTGWEHRAFQFRTGTGGTGETRSAPDSLSDLRHSAHIHSKNIDNITKYAKAIDTAILVKNAPSYAALGFGGEGYCTFTIASRTGEGLTSASTFTKRRRCVMADSLCIR